MKMYNLKHVDVSLRSILKHADILKSVANMSVMAIDLQISL